MFNIKEIRKEFPILKETINNKQVVYFDNGSTTLKPKYVIDAITDYLTKYTANVQRGDFIWSVRATSEFEDARKEVAKFLNANFEEVVFNSGTTQGTNDVSFWLEDKISKGDEIILNRAEHASNILPWMRIADNVGAKIIWAELSEDKILTVESIKTSITSKTKLIAVAGATNVIGDKRNIKEICALAKGKDIFTVIDAAQLVANTKIDVKEIDCDFLLFSGHKMYGPTGVGVLYGKKSLLENQKSRLLGGGMSNNFNENYELELKPLPYRLEAGTPNISGIIGLGAAVKWINKVGIENIKKHIDELKVYAVKELRKLKNIVIYNADANGSIITFNVKGIFGQDVSNYLSTKAIGARAGTHCAKILDFKDGNRTSIRIAFAVYNTKEEVDYLVKTLKGKTPEDMLDVFFG